MAKLLRDFTVAELEGLVVGARFVDSPDNDLHRQWKVTKTAPGEFTGPLGTKYGCDEVQAEWVRHDWAYALDTDGPEPVAEQEPNPLREALQPFAQYATLIPNAEDDDAVLFYSGDVKLTAGMFRAAAKAVSDV